MTTSLCSPPGHNRQQEEHSRQPKEPSQPQVDEHPPGLPAWALPVTPAKPGMATSRRQVGAGCCYMWEPSQSLPDLRSQLRGHRVQHGMSHLPSVRSHACLSHTVTSSSSPQMSVLRLSRDLRLTSCLGTCPGGLASGLQTEGHCQQKATPPRPKPLACVPLWELLSYWPQPPPTC